MQTAARRSERVLADVPVVIYGTAGGHTPFREETFTVTINAHGALLMLEAKVSPGQRLTLSNSTNSEQRECRVAYAGPDRAGLAQVAVEFTRPAPEFWALASPPPSWSAAKSG
ncbi:MAG TPA: hypothetical protein VN661_09740 [Candidatus Acidoferrales bacterium]|nr:hypothetical protein [Candidatus Acidoferrales bacterium]